MQKTGFFFVVSLIVFLTAPIPGKANKTVGEIYVDLQKLQSLKRVLYIAAHPDDENTRALAWFSLGQKAETAYLSLTRGDGGQNLIGNELNTDLGVLRTHELLAARSYDKAQQFFTRAIDFGYSRSADESFKKWGKEAILEDVVLMIRKFKPDVIITRFPPDERAGHGHHTASALIAIEAFDKAADPTYLPEQVKIYGTWQTTSLYWNASNWWNKDIDSIARNNPNYLVENIGTYDPYLGMSYNEIGTLARSQHKCQGFGAIIERSERFEYFEYLAGKKLSHSFFENNTSSWSELINPQFEERLNRLVENFNFKYPDHMIPELLLIYQGISSLPESVFKTEKLNRCAQLILDCAGIYVDVSTEDYSFPTSSSATAKLEINNRSPYHIDYQIISINKSKINLAEQSVHPNETSIEAISFELPPEISTPYWLKNEHNGTLFSIEPSQTKGLASAPAPVQVTIRFSALGQQFQHTLPVIHKWRDPAFGERKRETIGSPEFAVQFDQEIGIAQTGSGFLLKMKIHSFSENLHQDIKLIVPEDWKISQELIELRDIEKHEEVWFELQIDAGRKAERGQLKILQSNEKTAYCYREINYDHVPYQTIFQPAELDLVPLDAEIIEGKVLYITGVEDAVPTALKQLGFEVDQKNVSELNNLKLSEYMSVIIGIRAYNVYPELLNYNQILFDYVENGGNVVMQYNTASRELSNQSFGPLPFKLSRDRVTEEDAKVTFLAPDSPLLNEPNKIELIDFDNWTQERGLYFAGEWDNAYTPILSWSDEGQNPANGGLLVLNHGKGRFIYTGISFFRLLPNGVPGAFRLFANLVSYKK